jgi:hypothetical protein
MPLPFLKQKPVAGLIINHRQPDGNIEEKQEKEDGGAGLHACCEDILRAVKANDAAHLAEALRSAFQVMEMEPHDEAGHEDDSFQALNQKAAKED